MRMKLNNIDQFIEKNHDIIAKFHVPDVLPILPVQDRVVFPYESFWLVLPEEQKKIVEDCINANKLIGIFLKTEAGGTGLSPFGVMASISDVRALPDGYQFVSAKALKRIKILDIQNPSPYITARVADSPERIVDEKNEKILYDRLQQLSTEMIKQHPHLSDDLLELINKIETPLKFCYLAAANLRISLAKRQEILNHNEVETKLEALIKVVEKELDVLKLDKSIDNQVKSTLTRNQKEFYLRQRMAAIQKELGESDVDESEADEYRKKIEKSALSDEAKKEAERELKRFSALSPQSPDYAIIRNYLDWLVELPWEERSQDRSDIFEAKNILNRDHYGIDRVKERIIEYLTVHHVLRERRPDAGKGKTMVGANRMILCLTGPPGTGKTSLGKSIAESLGRKYTRMSLGGMRDEAEIRGHRRTYIGAMPGRIIQAVKRAGTRNPVFILDEIDKVGQDWRGDPSSALLEVLDPEQNSSFRDHYLDVDFDLSEVMFIATANQLDTIPAPLRDRMDIIHLEGYSDYEKFEIARSHLIPRQFEAHGLEENEVVFNDASLYKLIHNYTREAGVRGLERLIGSILRKSIVRIKETNENQVMIDEKTIQQMLKKEIFQSPTTEEIGIPGIATGLAVTPAGGDILYIEAARIPGNGQLKLTGQLGNVMQESAQIAYSYVHSRVEELNIDHDYFKNSDIHLHVPEGALPKDGPSAGIAMVMALVGIFTGRVVPTDIGLTGEITLRGRVLPVGGIKSKVLAAHRAGLTRVILPARNRRDEEDLPDIIKEAIELCWVETTDEALTFAFAFEGEKIIS